MVTNMIKFELRRLLKKTSFYICLGLCIAFTLLIIINTKMYFDSSISFLHSDYDAIKRLFTNKFSPEVISLNGTEMMLPIVLAVFTGIFVCEDKVRGTIKNIYARGYSRTNVFFAKFLVLSITAFLFYMTIFITSYLSGLVIFATSNLNVEMVHTKGYFLLILGRLVTILAINTLYFMLSEFIGSLGFSIAANIFTPGLMSALLTVIVGVIIRISGNYHNNYIYISKIMEYWIHNLLYSGFNIGMETTDYLYHLVASIVYFVVLGALSWLIIHKKQIKN